VGESAFAHKAGMHVDAVSKVSQSFEHVDPALVGNERRILMSELSGASNVRLKTGEMGLDFQKDAPAVKDILKKLEHLEKSGYAFESADASFKLLVQKVLKKHVPFFELEGFSVVVQKDDAESKATTVATIKINVKGQTELTAGEGDGPVDALNDALRKVLRRFYPAIDSVVLEDYHVRILDPETATRATTRVLIDSSDGHEHWGTVGVSENIIEASWEAWSTSCSSTNSGAREPGSPKECELPCLNCRNMWMPRPSRPNGTPGGKRRDCSMPRRTREASRTRS
jgi:2-isopropylmalate synthase